MKPLPRVIEKAYSGPQQLEERGTPIKMAAAACVAPSDLAAVVLDSLAGSCVCRGNSIHPALTGEMMRRDWSPQTAGL